MQTENLNTSNHIRTFTGKYIDPFNPDPDLICIEDIAHALAQVPRFGGHLPKPYTVAQHSVHCTERLIKPEDQLCALMHDASEAYLMDIPRPVKHRLPVYTEIEEQLMKVIAEKFGFAWPKPEYVTLIDEYMLNLEWRHLMIEQTGHLSVWTSGKAEMMFLETFKNLM